MVSALGLMEYLKIPTGMVAADKMAKASNIEIIHASVVCPGKYIVLFKGKLSEVLSAMESGTKGFEENIIDSFVLGNPEKQIYSAISSSSSVEIKGALGIVESYSVASIVEAADIAAKTAIVDVIEIRLARGMCGKSLFTICGELAAVEAAIEKSKNSLKEKGMLLDTAIIPNPSPNFVSNLY